MKSILVKIADVSVQVRTGGDNQDEMDMLFY